MAIATCARCQNQSFELQEAKVSGTRHRLMFVQCASCGAPAGVVDSHTASLLQEQDQRIKSLQEQLTALESSVSHMRHLVSTMANQRAV